MNQKPPKMKTKGMLLYKYNEMFTWFQDLGMRSVLWDIEILVHVVQRLLAVMTTSGLGEFYTL